MWQKELMEYARAVGCESKSDLARMLGISPQLLQKRLRSPSWSLQFFCAVCQTLELNQEQMQSLFKSMCNYRLDPKKRQISRILEQCPIQR